MIMAEKTVKVYGAIKGPKMLTKKEFEKLEKAGAKKKAGTKKK